MLAVATPSRRAARSMQRDEALQEMHVRVLAVRRTYRDLTLEISAVRQPPAPVERIAERLGDGEQIGALERPSRMGKRQQHERLIVKIGARVEHSAVVVEPVDVEPVRATSALDKEFDVGVNHLCPGTRPAEPAELAEGKDMAGLDEEAMRASVSFATDRQTLGKKRRWAVGFRLPKMGCSLEQPSSRMRGDVFERHGRSAARRPGKIHQIDLPLHRAPASCPICNRSCKNTARSPPSNRWPGMPAALAASMSLTLSPTRKLPCRSIGQCANRSVSMPGPGLRQSCARRYSATIPSGW